MRRALPALSRHLQAQTCAQAASVQVARRFAYAPTREDAHIKIPKQLHGVAGKYATSLFVIAARRNLLEPVEQELRQVAGAAKASPSFLEFMKDPSVPYDKRVKAVVDIFEKSQFSDVTKNFLALLAEYGRLKEIFKVVENYHELLLAHKGK